MHAHHNACRRCQIVEDYHIPARMALDTADIKSVLLKQKNGPAKGPYLIVLYGAGTKSRTRDLLITNQLLYQLSYAGKIKIVAAIPGSAAHSGDSLLDCQV